MGVFLIKRHSFFLDYFLKDKAEGSFKMVLYMIIEIIVAVILIIALVNVKNEKIKGYLFLALIFSFLIYLFFSVKSILELSRFIETL